MSKERWTPPWHRGFGWMVFGAIGSIVMNYVMNIAFRGDVSYWIMVPAGLSIGGIFWFQTWSAWKEFGPDWDGGI